MLQVFQCPASALSSDLPALTSSWLDNQNHPDSVIIYWCNLVTVGAPSASRIAWMSDYIAAALHTAALHGPRGSQSMAVIIHSNRSSDEARALRAQALTLRHLRHTKEALDIETLETLIH